MALVTAGLAGAALTTGSPPPESLSPPLVVGKPQVGRVLTATTGRWRTATVRGAVFAFQWQRCEPAGANCVDLPGATDGIYPVVVDDVDGTLRVVVTAVRGDARTSIGSQATKSVVAGPVDAPSSEVPPTLSGKPEVGEVLTIQPGAWSGVQPIRLQYRWRRCAPTGGVCRMLGARGQAYTIRSRDAGATFRALVLADNAAGSGAALSSPTAPVVGPPAPEPPRNTVLPAISGTAQQGKTLSGTSGSWSGTGPIEFGFRWLRCDASGDHCLAIPGASRQSYTLGSADVGRTLRLRVVAENVAGTRAAMSARTQVVSSTGTAPVNVALPTIGVQARDGSTLSASEGRWRGDQPIRFSFQWLRCDAGGGDCDGIGGATSRRYTPEARDVGRRLRIQVLGTNATGSASVLSAPTAVVAARATLPTNHGAPVLSGAAQQGATLALTSGSWSGTQPISFAYRWVRCDGALRDCHTIGGARASSYVVTRADVGHRLYGVVTAKNAAGASSTSSNPTGLVVGAPFNTAAPTITGAAVEGRTLSAQPGAWTGVGTITFVYQWTRCGAGGDFASCAPIVVTSSASYTVRNADVGHRILVQVKATNGLGESFANSAQTDVVLPAPSVPPAPVPVAPVTIAVPRNAVGYGAALALHGRGQPGRPVTIVQRRASGATLVLWNAAVVSPAGTWRYVVRPTVPSTYRARVDGHTSRSVSVRIRPAVALTRAAAGKLAVRVRAARAFSGRLVVVQRWDVHRHRWVVAKRVRLGGAARGSSSTVVTSATFRVRVPHGARLRAVFPGRNAGPGYLTGVSNRVRS